MVAYEDAIRMLAIARQMETEAKDLKEKASEILMPYMEREKLTKLQGNDGTVEYVSPKVQKTFKKDIAKEMLLLGGVSAQVISECFAKAVEEKPKAGYIKFKAK